MIGTKSVRGIALGALVALLGCENVTSPRAGAGPGGFQASYSTAGASFFSIPTPLTNDQTTGWTSTGLSVAAGQAVMITVTGSLQFDANQTRVEHFGAPPIIPNPIGPAGASYPYGGAEAVSVRIRRDSATVVNVDMSPAWVPSANSITGVVMGPGVIEIARLAGVAGGASCISTTLSCPNGANFEEASDYNVSGSQQLMLQPIAPDVSADKSAIAAGDTVTFTADASWTSDWSVVWGEGWGWIPSDGSTPMAMNCSGTRSCRFAVPKSGRPVIGVSAAGGLHFLPVYGPTIHVWNPSDSLGHLVAQCTSPGQRGSTVNCTAYGVDSSGARVDFSILLQRATAMSDSFDLTDTVSAFYSAGATHSWSGEAVTGTMVTFTGLVGGAVRAATATFAPTPREWSRFQATSVNEIAGLDPADPNMTPMIANGTAIGHFNPVVDSMFFGASAAQVQTGPNRTLGYLTAEPGPLVPRVFIHPQLYPGHVFFDDQNSTGSGTCDSTAAVQLRENVRRHEGATLASNSHYGVANSVFADSRPDSLLEKLVVVFGTPDIVRESAYDVWLDFIVNPAKPHAIAQNAFDSADHNSVFALGCSLDFNPNDP